MFFIHEKKSNRYAEEGKSIDINLLVKSVEKKARTRENMPRRRTNDIRNF